MALKLSGESQAVVLKYSIIAVLGVFVYFQLKKGVSNAVEFVTDLDLNPFDSSGFLGLTVPETTLKISGTDPSHKAALAKLGADITKYKVYYPNPLAVEKLPKGTLQVKWGGNKITYYAPKTGLDVFLM